MYVEGTFKSELISIWDKVKAFKPNWYKIASQDIEIKDAWELYSHARASTLSELLLGDVKLRSQMEVLKNFGTTSGSESTMERQTLYDDKDKLIYPVAVNEAVRLQLGPKYRKNDGIQHIRLGSVLNDGWWWPFKNDAWVIGGIHGLKRFHLAMVSVPDDLIWDTSSGRPRVLGRELMGLASFGYSLIGVPSWAKKDPAPTTGVPVTPTGLKPPVKTTPVPAKIIRETIGNVFAPQSKKLAEAATFKAYYEALTKVKSITDIKDGILKKEVAFDAYDFKKI